MERLFSAASYAYSIPPRETPQRSGASCPILVRSQNRSLQAILGGFRASAQAVSRSVRLDLYRLQYRCSNLDLRGLLDSAFALTIPLAAPQLDAYEVRLCFGCLLTRLRMEQFFSQYLWR
jgi:hypothetical protein